ncbi:hypothetical protein Efla_006521 [Eimeria flavescens]
MASSASSEAIVRDASSLQVTGQDPCTDSAEMGPSGKNPTDAVHPMAEAVTEDGTAARAARMAVGATRCSEAEGGDAPTSKNALRKLRRQKWLQDAKDRRRALRADAKRRKKSLKREAAASRVGEPAEKHAEDAGLSVRVCVDCEFEELQEESEIYSLVQQLMYAYGDANRLNRQRDKASGTRRRWKSGWRSKPESTVNHSEATQCCHDSHESSADPALSSGGTCSLPGFAEGEEPAPFQPDGGRVPQSDSAPTAGACSAEESVASVDDGVPPSRPAVNLCMTGVGPKIRDALKRVQCNGRWKCEVCEAPFQQKFAEECAAGQAVYLTADADEELQLLEPDTVYIVGGIVDRNRYKGLTLKRSQERGIRAAKLPISTRLGRKLEGSKILTVNQASLHKQTTRASTLQTGWVVSVLIAFAELGDWTAALNKVLPPRKRAEIDSRKDNSALEENILLSG